MFVGGIRVENGLHTYHQREEKVSKNKPFLLMDDMQIRGENISEDKFLRTTALQSVLRHYPDVLCVFLRKDCLRTFFSVFAISFLLYTIEYTLGLILSPAAKCANLLDVSSRRGDFMSLPPKAGSKNAYEMVQYDMHMRTASTPHSEISVLRRGAHDFRIVINAKLTIKTQTLFQSLLANNWKHATHFFDTRDVITSNGMLTLHNDLLQAESSFL